MSPLQKAGRLPALLPRVPRRCSGLCLGSKVRVPPTVHSELKALGAREGPGRMSDPSFTCRTKHISGSPRHKGLKKTHFIKNMRQYDTKNSRYRLRPAVWGCPPCPPSNLVGRGPALGPQGGRPSAPAHPHPSTRGTSSPSHLSPLNYPVPGSLVGPPPQLSPDPGDTSLEREC